MLAYYEAKVPGEQLLTRELLKQLPPMNTQRHAEDPIVPVRFFHAIYDWEAFPLEFDPDKLVFWGLVNGNGPDFGYFDIEYLDGLMCPAGILGVERDLSFEKRRISAVIDDLFH
mgnify:FL=1